MTLTGGLSSGAMILIGAGMLTFVGAQIFTGAAIITSLPKRIITRKSDPRLFWGLNIGEAVCGTFALAVGVLNLH